MAGEVVSTIISGEGNSNIIAHSLATIGSINNQGHLSLRLLPNSANINSFTFVPGLMINVVSASLPSSISGTGFFDLIALTNNENSLINKTYQIVFQEDLLPLSFLQDFINQGKTDISFSLVYDSAETFYLTNLDTNDCSTLNIVNTTATRISSWEPGNIVLPSTIVKDLTVANNYKKLEIQKGEIVKSPALTYSSPINVSYVTRP